MPTAKARRPLRMGLRRSDRDSTLEHRLAPGGIPDGRGRSRLPVVPAVLTAAGKLAFFGKVLSEGDEGVSAQRVHRAVAQARAGRNE